MSRCNGKGQLQKKSFQFPNHVDNRVFTDSFPIQTLLLLLGRGRSEIYCCHRSNPFFPLPFWISAPTEAKSGKEATNCSIKQICDTHHSCPVLSALAGCKPSRLSAQPGPYAPPCLLRSGSPPQWDVPKVRSAGAGPSPDPFIALASPGWGLRAMQTQQLSG